MKRCKWAKYLVIDDRVWKILRNLVMTNMNVPNHSPGYDRTTNMRQETNINILLYRVQQFPWLTQRMLILFPATFNLFVVSRFTRPTFPPLPLTGGGGGGGGCSPIYPPEQLSLSSVLTYTEQPNIYQFSPHTGNGYFMTILWQIYNS